MRVIHPTASPAAVPRAPAAPARRRGSGQAGNAAHSDRPSPAQVLRQVSDWDLTCGARWHVERRRVARPTDTIVVRLDPKVRSQVHVAARAAGGDASAWVGHLLHHVRVEELVATWQTREAQARSHDSRDYGTRYMLRLDRSTRQKLDAWAAHFKTSGAEIIRYLVAHAAIEDFPKDWQTAGRARHQRREHMLHRHHQYAEVSFVAFSFLLIVLLVLSLGSATAAMAPSPGDFRGCPEQGQGGDPDLNRLKNRSAQVSTPEPMTVAQINALTLSLETLHRTRAAWPAGTRDEIAALEGTGAEVEGFVIMARQQGPETTNGTRKDLRDYHLWIVDMPDQTRAQAVVAEVTPRWLGSNPGWRLRLLNRLVQQHAKFRLTGWLMLDPEHLDQISKTRGGLWELHPVTTVEVFSGGQWVAL